MTTLPHEQILAELLARDPLPPLAPKRAFDAKLRSPIKELSVSAAEKAVLHLLNDDLAESHELAQAGEGEPLFDYLHSIVHRREGDFDNCKYWLRRTGRHPVLEQIYGDPAAAIGFVDQCRTSAGSAAPELERLQQRELAALLDLAQQQGVR